MKGIKTQMILLTYCCKGDSRFHALYYSDHLVFYSLIYPAGSKRLIRLNLNIRGGRKITTGAKRRKRLYKSDTKS